MKQGQNQRRSRGRGNNNGHRRNNRNQSFESNGPDVKVRGTAQQVLDKYLQLARDAQSGGDRVKAEAYLQFAEHYYRIANVDQEGDQKGDRSKSDRNAEQADSEASERPQRKERTDRKERPQRGRGRGRGAQQKNEATLAAEAAAANEEAQKAAIVEEEPSAPEEAEVEVLNAPTEADKADEVDTEAEAATA